MPEYQRLGGAHGGARELLGHPAATRRLTKPANRRALFHLHFDEDDVIGPTRMPYEKVIAIVDYTSTLVNNVLDV